MQDNIDRAISRRKECPINFKHATVGILQFKQIEMRKGGVTKHGGNSFRVQKL
jgi:hypothetical protein